jgi:S1-C subfamily serine protease
MRRSGVQRGTLRATQSTGRGEMKHEGRGLGADQPRGAGVERGAAAARARRLPVFPPIPVARRRRRRRWHVVTTLVAGIVGGLVAVMLAPMLTGGEDTAPAALPVSRSSGTEPHEEMARGTVARVARAVLPSVVRINRSADAQLEGSGNGSGVVYRADGLIVTNNHVIEGSGQVDVVFVDGQTLPAEIVGQDALNDLAVVRVDRDDLDAVAIGRTQDLEVGDLAVAVGSPFGLDATVTVGVVSALGRGVHAGAVDGAPIFLPEVIQTDAPINPGNSGGALVDRDGRLIGINSAILTSGEPANAGVGFAIPVDTVVDVADQLIAEGRVRHPLLGVSGGPVGAHAAERLGVRDGAWIREVSPGTPASAAGLTPDDVIVAVGDQPIASMEELSIAVRDREVGERVVISYVRDGRRRTVEVVLGERATDGPQ